MTCGPHDGITIELPTHDVEVRPLETDLRMRERNYVRGQFKLQEEAGRLLASYHGAQTLAFVKIDGVRAHRMMIPQDGIKFERNLREKIVCTLDLLDARKVLAQGSIEQSFRSVSAGRIVDTLLSERHDPNDIITGYEFIQEGDDELVNRTSPLFSIPADPFAEDDTEAGEFPLLAGVGNLIEILGWGERLGVYTFDFDGQTILSAFEEAMNQFGLNWWVEVDGTLYIGPDGTRGQIISTESGNNQLALSRYTITSSAKTVNAVQVRATVMQEEEITAEEVNERNRVAPPEKKATRAVAEAYAPEVDGDLLIIPLDQSFDSLSQLELAARRHLYQQIKGDASGSLEINGLASTNVAGIRDLDVGDYLLVDSDIEADCNRNVITGIFQVTSVHHRAGPRKGWQISVEVTRVPNPEQLRSVSTFYDPQTDRDYESLRTYDYPSAT